VTGDQLRDWMARHRYTAPRLAAELGVAERSVFRWRTSTRVPAYLALALESLERHAASASRDGRATDPEVERSFGGNALDLEDRERLAG
jgi:hypothetical protein